MNGEILATDLTRWEVGPFHGSLPGPMRLTLALDGEVVVSCRVETGFLHKGLEKAMELHAWPSAVVYAGHVDPEGSVFGELALCQAVEALSGLEAPPRALAIRAILSELNRISAHLGYIARFARMMGADTLLHYVLRDREKVLDLFELLTGARFSVNFVRYGGVRADVTEGFIERVVETCDLIRIRLKEYNDLFTFNRVFVKSTSGVGCIPEAVIRQCGITGPNARASAVAFDVRKAHPYSGLDRFSFEVPLGPTSAGDAHDRFLVRLKEISQSLEILRQAAESVPFGEHAARKPEKEFKFPAGEAYSRVESSRGLLGCHLVSDGGSRPHRVQFRVPTHGNLQALPMILPGTRVEDLPIILASLDLCLAEADR